LLCQRGGLPDIELKNHHKKPVRPLESLCAEPHPGDGIPPHVLKKQQHRDERAADTASTGNARDGVNARLRQYCKAAHRALEAGLVSACGDERLKDLRILSVEPLRGAGSNLLVVVAAPATAAEVQPMKALEKTLQNAAGLLRSVIATEIQRKRTPHLTFRVVPET
jgi:ribosome-binding factor A